MSSIIVHAMTFLGKPLTTFKRPAIQSTPSPPLTMKRDKQQIKQTPRFCIQRRDTYASDGGRMHIALPTSTAANYLSYNTPLPPFRSYPVLCPNQILTNATAPHVTSAPLSPSPGPTA